jgi:TonB family protein
MTGKLTIIVGCCVALTCLLQAQAPPIYVPPSIQQHRLIYNVRPVYPKLAIQAHIQGTVRLAALIDDTGTVERLKLISGHPFLVKAAFDAVKQWPLPASDVQRRPGGSRHHHRGDLQYGDR